MRATTAFWIVTVLALCGSAARAQTQRAVIGGDPVSLPPLRAVVGADAAMLDLKRVQGDRNLVLFFFSEQCGVTYYYKARLQKLLRDFDDGERFVFVGVRCGKRENPNAPLELAEAKYLSIPFADDSRGELLRTFGVRQSLTFAVLDKTGRLRYLGGIDDNVDTGKIRATPLRDALRAISAGKPVPVKSARTLGCAIVPL